MSTTDEFEREKGRWEMTKNIVEVIAIVVGGIWALINFGLKDVPAMALRNRAESTLTWSHRRDTCVHAEYNVTLTNSGSSTFDLTKAVLREWILDSVYLSKVRHLYLDVNEIMRRNTPTFTKTFERNEADTFGLGTPFIGEYKGGAVWRENFDFAFRRDTTKLVLFTIQFYKDGGSDPSDWTYDWSPIGGEDSVKQ